jgi:hypothetical protein
MAAEIEAALGIEGHSSVLGDSLTWSPATQSEDSRRLVISVRAKDGATEVNVHEEFALGGFRRMFVPAGGIAGALAGLGIGALVGITGPLLAIPGLAVGIVGGIQGVIRIEKRMRRPQLEELAGRAAEKK